jgi:hypothetical protein
MVSEYLVYIAGNQLVYKPWRPGPVAETGPGTSNLNFKGDFNYDNLGT